MRDERAVLCAPGNVDEFVDAVVGLAARLRSGNGISKYIETPAVSFDAVVIIDNECHRICLCDGTRTEE